MVSFAPYSRQSQLSKNFSNGILTRSQEAYNPYKYVMRDRKDALDAP